MKTLFLILAISSVNITLGQTHNWTNLKLFAGRATDYGHAIYVDKADNYYITGTFYNVEAFGIDSLIVECKGIPAPQLNSVNGFLLRYDSSKNLNLSLTIAAGLIGETVTDNSGNIIVSGALTYGAIREGLLKKYSPSGNELWTKFIQSFSSDNRPRDNVINSLDIYKDGSTVISGFSYGSQVSIFGTFISGLSNYVVKMDKFDNIQWINNFSSTLGFGINKVKFDEEGDVIVTGNERNTVSNHTDILIGKLSGISGNIMWKKNFSAADYFTPFVRSIGVYSGKYVFGGSYGEQINIENNILNSIGDVDIFLLQTDTAGNITWVKHGGSPGPDKLLNMVCDQNGNVIATGTFSDNFKISSANLTSKGNTDVYILAFDSTGNLLWAKSGGSNIAGHTGDYFYDEYGSGITVDSKNQIQVVGTTIGSGNFGSLVFNAPENAGQNAFWLTLGNKENIDTINYPCTNLIQNPPFLITVFPNPFRESLSVKNSQNKRVTYAIELYNSMGQSLYKKNENETIITITDWKQFPSGIYFLVVEAENKKQTFKIVKQ